MRPLAVISVVFLCPASSRSVSSAMEGRRANHQPGLQFVRVSHIGLNLIFCPVDQNSDVMTDAIAAAGRSSKGAMEGRCLSNSTHPMPRMYSPRKSRLVCPECFNILA
jgi:hypothetical protein